LAVSAYLGARCGDFNSAIFFNLFFQFFVDGRLEFADGAAFQASDVNVIARAVAFVKMLIAAQVQQVQLIDQSVAFQQVERAVNRDAMDSRIDFYGSIEDGTGIEVTLGAIHYLENNFSLSGEADTLLGKSFLQPAGALVGVDAFAGGDSMCGGGHGAV
jgi:hypothetical protein